MDQRTLLTRLKMCLQAPISIEAIYCSRFTQFWLKKRINERKKMRMGLDHSLRVYFIFAIACQTSLGMALEKLAAYMSWVVHPTVRFDGMVPGAKGQVVISRLEWMASGPSGTQSHKSVHSVIQPPYDLVVIATPGYALCCCWVNIPLRQVILTQRGGCYKE